MHRAETWSDFSADWQEALNEARPLKSLHMTSSFHGWTPAQREAKLLRLAAVINKYEPLSLTCSINKSDYKALVVPNAPYDLRDPYGICFQTFVITAARLASHFNIKGQIDFVFDCQGNSGTNAALWYPLIKQLQEPWIKEMMGATPIFRSDEDVLPLQAADMLAWHRRILFDPHCSVFNRKIADDIIFNHAELEVPIEMMQSWGKAFAATPGIERTKSKHGSVKRDIARILQEVPEDHLVPYMNRLHGRSMRAHRIQKFLSSLGLENPKKRFRKLVARLGRFLVFWRD
jgi:hypothetical protein